MTRDSDEYVSLEDRVQIARDANAALMISIHADTFPARSPAQADDIYGTTVYTCSDRASDAEAARIAARENAADRDRRRQGAADDSGVADILFDLKRRETRAYAHLFSRGLVSELRGAGRLNRHPERSAGFFVLKAPDYPSVLVELGYLSNAEDVANMTDPDWRQRGVAAIAAAIDRFFAANPRGGEASPSLAKRSPTRPTDHALRRRGFIVSPYSQSRASVRRRVPDIAPSMRLWNGRHVRVQRAAACAFWARRNEVWTFSMRAIGRFLGFLFATGAILFVIAAAVRRRGDLHVTSRTCPTTPSSRTTSRR